MIDPNKAIDYLLDPIGKRDIHDDAVEFAVKAIKLQIPQKATGDHYAHKRCPTCNHRIPSGGGSSSRRRDNWCNYCGQKIDWDRKELN